LKNTKPATIINISDSEHKHRGKKVILRQRAIRLILAFILLSLFLPSSQPARAQLSTCSVSASPDSVAPGSDSSFNFGLYNSDSDPIQWVQITRPAGGYVTLEDSSAYQWQADTQTDTATFTNGSLDHGFSQGFSVQALARSQPGGPVDWSVQISDQADGSGAITCPTDYLSLTIQTQPSIINISNVRATSVSQNKVTILWDTDVASTSQVQYGADSSYGASSSLDSSLVTAHSVTLSGLTENTVYHYDVTSTTPADGGTATSGDNTFLTAVAPPPATGGGGGSKSGFGAPNVPGVSLKANPTEQVPPTITLSSDISHPFKAAPTITGQASDNDALAKIEYSTDGGRDWLPVNSVSGTSKQLSWSFTPTLSDDGNYVVVMRATDASGNTATTKPMTLVIDRLPPQVGAALIAVGPNQMLPDSTGAITTVAGVAQRVTVSAIGGPIAVTLHARPLFGATLDQTFSLTRSEDTGLWSGLVSFQKAGAYTITADSEDGAGNRSHRPLFNASVSAAPAIHGSAPLNGATVTVYTLDPETGAWETWDAPAYDQVNPQTTPATGVYHLVLPAGKYYLRASAPGYRPTISRIFSLGKATPISTSLSLEKSSWLDFLPNRATVSTDPPRLQAQPIGLLPGQMPGAYQVQSLTGAAIGPLDLAGKPTVITLFSTWHPSTSEQLPQLASLQQNHDLNVVPVAEQEGTAKARVFLGRAGLSLSMAADPDGQLITKLNPSAMPTHYFFDRAGKLKNIVVGVLTVAQLQQQLQ
jgi:hypothetical protein